MRNEDILRSRQLAGRVERYHTWPMIRKPTVAESSCRVATLYCELWGLPRAEVLYYILHHDDGELTSGDVPFGAKRAVPELAETVNKAGKMGLLTLGVSLPKLTHEEFAMFKIADLLEMWECGLVEFNMGNRYGKVIMDNVVGPVHSLSRELCRTADVMRWMMENRGDEHD